VYAHSDGSANSTAGDGTLSAAAPPAAMKADRYRYDPLDPVPSIGGRYFEIGGSRPGPFDQRHVEERKDVLVYTSNVLQEGLEIAGTVRLRLFVGCSARDTDIVTKVCDVYPNGDSYNIVDEFYRCRWREGYDKTVLFEPDRVYEFDIDLGPVAHYFKHGHRVRLQVTSSAFPHFDRNMNTGNPIGVDAKGEVAEISIFHDAERPSRLILPVVSGAL
jgi:putative CocE/NonD family hydrolase